MYLFFLNNIKMVIHLKKKKLNDKQQKRDVQRAVMRSLEC